MNKPNGIFIKKQTFNMQSSIRYVKNPEIRKALEKPINLVLNCRFQNGEIIETQKNLPLMIYQKKQKNNELTELIFAERQTIVVNEQEIQQPIEINESIPYCQRKLNNMDGLLYYYSMNKGRVDINIQYRNQYNNYIDEKQKFEKIQILICVTMYNENIEALNATLGGIQNNLPYFKELGICPEQIVVVVLQDGILKMDDTIKKFYSDFDQEFNFEGSNTVEQRIKLLTDEIKFYKDKKMEQQLKNNNDLPPTLPKKIALLYQTNIQIKEQEINGVKIDHTHFLTTLFLNKHLNGRKLSSHMWFFQGFCRLLKPKYCALVDVGTMPDSKGLVNYFKALESNDQLGGVSGFMGLYFDEDVRKSNDKKFNDEYTNNQKYYQQYEQELMQNQQKNYKSCCYCLYEYIWKLLIDLHYWVDVRKAQLFEYTMAHILDKNFESCFSFLHVLPGAWSAYRYSAMVKSYQFKESIIEKKYLKTALRPEEEEKDHEEANMFLAEDRILCLGIYTQIKSQYILKYIPTAIARTDAVDNFIEFLNQRRRWINSSWFALNYVLRNFYDHLQQSNHPWYRYITTTFTMFIAWLGKVNVFFLLTFYYFSVHISSFQLFGPLLYAYPTYIQMLPGLIPLCYLLLVFYLIIASIIYPAKGKYNNFAFISAILGIYTIGMFAIVIIKNICLNFVNNSNKCDTQDQNQDLNQDQKDKEYQECITTWLVLGMVIANLGSLTFIVLIHPQYIWDILRSTLSYIYYSATYTHTMVIYSFCNIDDITWGTKGLAGGGNKKYLQQKVSFVAQWMFCNALASYCLIGCNSYWDKSYKDKSGYVLIAVGLYATGILVIKVFFAICYHIYFYVYEIYHQNNVTKNKKDIYRKIGQQFYYDLLRGQQNDNQQQPMINLHPDILNTSDINERFLN